MISPTNRLQASSHNVGRGLNRDGGRKNNMKTILPLVILCFVSVVVLAENVDSITYLDANRALKSAREYVQDGAINYFSTPLAWTNLSFESLTYNFDSPMKPITIKATIISSVRSNAVSTNVTDVTSDKVIIYMDNFGIMVGNEFSLGNKGRLISVQGADVQPPDILITGEDVDKQ